MRVVAVYKDPSGNLLFIYTFNTGTGNNNRNQTSSDLKYLFIPKQKQHLLLTINPTHSFSAYTLMLEAAG